jgi:hypothetical protein
MSLLLMGCGSGRSGGGGAPTTSYANAGGTGDRTASITITTDVTPGGGTTANLINGDTADNVYWWAGGQSSRSMRFDFGSGASKVIDEFKWYQSGAFNQGTWKLGGSNDGSTITDFPETFLLGNATTQTNAVTNSTGYRYYHLRQTAGFTQGVPWVYEAEFKIADA